MKDKTGLIIEWVCGVVFLCFCFYVFSNYNLVPKHQLQARAAVQEEKQPGEPIIEGPPEFQKEIKDTLALIKEKAPTHYQNVCRYIKGIKLTNEEISHRIPAWTNDSGILYVSNSGYADHLKINTLSDMRMGRYFFVMLLAHETAHQLEIERNQLANIEEEEHQALAAERDILKLIGVDTKTIETLTGDHVLQQRWWEDMPQN